MYDAQTEMLITIMDKATERSANCERGVIAVGEVNGFPCGFALIAPDCIGFAMVFHPEVQPFDLCLN